MTVALVVIAVMAIAVAAYFLFLRKKEKPVVKEDLTTQKPQTPDKPEEKPKEEPKEEPEVEEERVEDFIVDAFYKNLDLFKDVVDVPMGGTLFGYLYCLTHEAYYQYYDHSSYIGIPHLYWENNFPTAMRYWNDEKCTFDDEDTYHVMLKWLFTLVLCEVRPDRKKDILAKGCGIMEESVYGYRFDKDPNVARLVAATIYSAARGKTHPDMDKIRKEAGGSRLGNTLAEILNADSGEAEGTGFWTDFRDFIPSAPGPYAPGYGENRRDSFLTDNHDEYGNLHMDREIHEYIVNNYNLDNDEHRQTTVQAIADKEPDENHLYGDYRTTKHYHFHPVFGLETIGRRIDPEGIIAALTHDCMYLTSYSREILQSRETVPAEYGRLRPGCSWNEEAKPNSYDDNRRNVLVDLEIEDGDGNPTGYYDKNNKWVYPDIVSSEEDYERYYQCQLWANSYSSGHSAAIIGAGMVLMELMPDKADKILRCLNAFAIGRTICRYHWTSDTIIGRIVGSVSSALCRAAKDYDERIEEAKKEL